ncbi:hypothetical protein N781_15000 [Pontibacillus halophilus JSM 076056 = DSM 19796]|uniref:DUF3939 domain-containing protein n=1 Tax=Pontibacillus halophilus JSM 076056 = DSM 19796 TaxID=1385510 RepID=A0A0A5GH96_9BACI|nr:DUF3939 domain-containing protein [Pontibacillus halophilus]KGX92631.1 hypothetical protein N781_15000 [Pontibacillus halophilus JSM 076056 = DSM 19796]
MWWKRKKKTESADVPSWPNREVSLHEVRDALRAFSDHLPQGVEMGTVINHDLTLNHELLAPYLKAVPTNTFYMSKETYELFEEKDYDLAVELDLIQQAVDKYIMQTKELPVIEGDPYRKVSFYKLESHHLLPERPNRDYFITEEEHMVTYKKR